MSVGQPYWQSYWYELRFRHEGSASFEPMRPGAPRRIPNEWLANGSVEEFVDRLLAEGADELDDLRGELRVLVYTEATPGPDSKAVLVRSSRGGGPANPSRAALRDEQR